MHLELTDAEAPALIALLKHAIDEDRYPLSERVQTWQGIPTSWNLARPVHSRYHGTSWQLGATMVPVDGGCSRNVSVFRVVLGWVNLVETGGNAGAAGKD